jgi:hypothetical protein
MQFPNRKLLRENGTECPVPKIVGTAPSLDLGVFGHFRPFCLGMSQGTDHTHTPDEQQNPKIQRNILCENACRFAQKNMCIPPYNNS